jgi:nucleoside-diphosphate-sugar epimerase
MAAIATRGEKVLVTGGAGFLGSWVVERLVSLGTPVRVIVRSGENQENIGALKGAIEIVEGDLTDDSFCRDATRGCTRLVHLAAIKKNLTYHAKHPAGVLDANVRMVANILSAAKDAGISRVVSLSSSRADAEWLESPHFGYAWSKKIGEIFGEAYRREYSMEVTSIRVESVFGPRDSFDPITAQVIPSLIRRILTDEENPLRVVAVRDAVKNFSFCEDVAGAIASILFDPIYHPVIVLAPSYAVSFQEVVEAIRVASAKEFVVEFLDGKNVERPTPIDVSLPQHSVESPLPFRDAIQRTVGWYRDHA